MPLISVALGLGELHVRSSMGQKLEAEIEFSSLSALEAESLTVRLAPPESFVQAGIDYPAALRSVRFLVEKKGDRSIIRLSSDTAINDPFLNLLIELNASGNRTFRQYVLLLDPPIITGPAVTVQTPEVNPLQTSNNKGIHGAVTQIMVPPASKAATEKKTTPATSETTPISSRSDGGPVVNPAAQDNTHRVKRGETLVAIATAHRSGEVSVGQWMLAMQRMNPQAFLDNNINRLKSGVVLRLPDAAMTNAIVPSEAQALIREQHAAFQRYRQHLAQSSIRTRDIASSAGRADDVNRAGPQSSSGHLSVAASEVPAASEAQDKLRLDKPSPTSSSEAAQRAAALDRIASEKALVDANARIAALEKNISDLQDLVQKSPKTEPAAQAEPVMSTPEATSSPVSVPPPKRMPNVPAVITPPPPVAEPSVLSVFQDTMADPTMMFMIVVGVVVVLVLVGVATRFLRRRRMDAGIETASVAPPSVFEQAGGGRHVDTSNSVFHSNFVPSVSQLDTNEVDAVAEADVYIAYGRDEQAEEILQDALRLHPDRHALRVKLLEIYATRKDPQRFGNLAAELRVLTHGTGEAWTQAAQMGRVLDPGNLLYGASSRDEQMTRGLMGEMASNMAIKPVTELPQPDAPPIAAFELRLEGLLGDQRDSAQPTIKKTASDLGSASAPAVDASSGGLDSDTSRTLEFQRSVFTPSPQATPGRVMLSSDVMAPAAPAMNVAALQTKLDLAIACEEIGDQEGARELLAEVARGADPELAGRAQSLLSHLA